MKATKRQRERGVSVVRPDWAIFESFWPQTYSEKLAKKFGDVLGEF